MNGHALDTALRELAELQHGVVGRHQARTIGAGKEQLRRRLASPCWDLLTNKVLRLAGTPETFLQRCMAAALDAGSDAVISHEAAAALWQLPGFGEGVVAVTRPDGSTSRMSPLAVVHDCATLPEHHVTAVAGIPVTTVARTVFDLAGAVHPYRAERALDNATARRLVTVSSLRKVAAEMREHGRAGSALMGELLAVRPDDYVPPDTGLEARFAKILKEAGLPTPVPQRNMGGERWVGRVDFRLPYGVVAEIDSSRHHSSRLDRQADAARDRELRAAGLRVVRVTDVEVWQYPQVAVGRVRTVLAKARSGAVSSTERARF